MPVESSLNEVSDHSISLDDGQIDMGIADPFVMEDLGASVACFNIGNNGEREGSQICHSAA